MAARHHLALHPSSTGPNVFRLRTLGTVSLEADGTPLGGRSTQRRRLALLALLAVAGDRGLRREKLVAYLWPDRDGEHARHALSQALYAMRHELGERALVGGIDELRLNEEIVAADVATFRHALSSGEPARAVSVYGGPFLDGFFVPEAPEFERWAEGERERLAREHARALEEVARAAERAGDHAGAVECWRLRAGLDPLNAHIALSLMRALEAAGDRAAAVQHARVHALLLREELDAPPDPAVAALAERLRTERATTGPVTAGAAADPVAVAPVAPAPDLERRPASPAPVHAAVAVASRTGPGGRIARLRRPLQIALAGTTLTLLVTAGALAFAGLQPVRGVPDDGRTIVLSTFRGSDSTLALAVQEALRAELASAPDVRLLGEASIRETLRLMAITGDGPLTADLARDVARRRGALFVVEGSVQRLGMGAQLVAELVDARTGASIATLSERPATTEQVIPAVARLGRALRERLTGAPPGKAPPALPAVTTASLPALQHYALALHALAASDRGEAIIRGEAALEHDSLFALAHYLVGDQLWFVDAQRHGESHLASAYALSDRLPPRERLLVRARYTHLVLDRPDSALTYWRLLRAAYPDEVLAHEGLGWAFRALGRPDSAAAAAAAAMRVDPTAITPNARNRMISLLELGDTAGAFDVARAIGPPAASLAREARFLVTALFGGPGGPAAALAEQADSVLPAPYRHSALVASGRLGEAARVMEEVVRLQQAQAPPRALIVQARAEVGAALPGRNARVLTRRALEWLAAADLSPPAYARLAERIADVAARTSDMATIDSVRRLIVAKDGGRGLPSYRYSVMAIDAAAAFAHGHMQRAAINAARAREQPIFSRSVGTLILLEADARRAMGQHDRADSLYRTLLSAVPFGDGDIETVMVLRPIAARGLERRR